jgi:predicted dinucleotide-utilizing enzyme
MKMSKLISIPMAMIACMLFAGAFAAEPVKTAATTPSTTKVHRYLIERTFPAGALAGLDAATKAKVNGNNASVGVRWIQSYANADKTKTFCVYEGPSEAAVRKAAQLNGLPVDSVMEVPNTLLPK